MYQGCAENIAATAQRLTFSDTVSRLQENISLETHPTLRLLGASREPTICSDAACYDREENPC